MLHETNILLETDRLNKKNYLHRRIYFIKEKGWEKGCTKRIKYVKRIGPMAGDGTWDE